MLAFQNKLHHFGPSESKNSWSAPTYQPHYSKYVIAVAGFPCPLNEAEIETYFDEAGVKVKGASFSWLATATEGEYVLQIQTTDPEQIRQLRDKEGKRHDSTFFLKWTLDLANTLKQVGTLGLKRPRPVVDTMDIQKPQSMLTAKEISLLTDSPKTTGNNSNGWNTVPGEK